MRNEDLSLENSCAKTKGNPDTKTLYIVLKIKQNDKKSPAAKRSTM